MLDLQVMPASFNLQHFGILVHSNHDNRFHQPLCVLLFHELQGQVGGFLGNGLYLLHSSALVAVATVSIHACELHAVRASDGQSKFECPGV